ncbi:Effector protein PevD1 [Emericellopsis cladophorae]|uniref:Effector protein PevD1 n=1 Tax=Emericellopsis cladophorae TaxID=2686198 RepID=A0A9P9Y5Q1_9HYPO|nr:Effector protein PevD1 [Emericellopsis cladophorae]KAI6784029.1 Effector protein PevD1 [Emericellopsis cladophorae]
MQLINLLPFLTLAAAAPKAAPTPSNYENVDIADFAVRKEQSASGEAPTFSSVSFKLSGDDATDLACSASNPDFSGEIFTCGDSKYRFALKSGSDDAEFGLTLYHELGPAVGVWGEGNVPTYCRAGGNGPNDFICQQVAAVTIGLNSDGSHAQ